MNSTPKVGWFIERLGSFFMDKPEENSLKLCQLFVAYPCFIAVGLVSILAFER